MTATRRQRAARGRPAKVRAVAADARRIYHVERILTHLVETVTYGTCDNL